MNNNQRLQQQQMENDTFSPFTTSMSSNDNNQNNHSHSVSSSRNDYETLNSSSLSLDASSGGDNNNNNNSKNNHHHHHRHQNQLSLQNDDNENNNDDYDGGGHVGGDGNDDDGNDGGHDNDGNDDNTSRDAIIEPRQYMKLIRPPNMGTNIDDLRRKVDFHQYGKRFIMIGLHYECHSFRTLKQLVEHVHCEVTMTHDNNCNDANRNASTGVDDHVEQEQQQQQRYSTLTFNGALNCLERQRSRLETASEASHSDGQSAEHGESISYHESGTTLDESSSIWIDIQNPSIADMKMIEKYFGLHPLTTEDIINSDQTGEKWELFSDYMFVVFIGQVDDEYQDIDLGRHRTHQLNDSGMMGSSSETQLNILVFPRFVLTIHDRPIKGLDILMSRIEKEFELDVDLNVTNLYGSGGGPSSHAPPNSLYQHSTVFKYGSRDRLLRYRGSRNSVMLHHGGASDSTLMQPTMVSTGLENEAFKEKRTIQNYGTLDSNHHLVFDPIGPIGDGEMRRSSSYPSSMSHHHAPPHPSTLTGVLSYDSYGGSNQVLPLPIMSTQLNQSDDEEQTLVNNDQFERDRTSSISASTPRTPTDNSSSKNNPTHISGPKYKQTQIPSSDWILYAFLDAMVDIYIPFVDSLVLEVEDLDDLVFELHDSEKDELLKRLGMAKRNVITLRRLLLPKQKMTSYLSVQPIRFISKPVQLYLRDVLDHLKSCLDKLEVARENLNQTHNNYMTKVQIEIAAASSRTDAFMNRITVIAALLGPLTLISGIFGMNVKVPGQDVDNLYWFYGLNGFMVIFALTLIILLRKKLV